MDLKENILSSKEIIDRAIAEYKPYAIVLMLSGGDDSMTALEVCKRLNVPLTHIMHGITGTGIQETTDFVRKIVSNEKPVYLEANAGDAYVKYVMRKGFFGVGRSAHNFTYHILKAEHFRKTTSKFIRQHKHNRRILFVNGARRLESENRKVEFINPVKVVGNDIWVNIINEWDKPECMAFLPCTRRSRVAIKICRSGECMCGTMQSKVDRIEASLNFPAWGKWLDGLEKIVKEKHGWGWGEVMPKKKKQPEYFQAELFQPMCIGCNKHFDDNQHLFNS